MSGSSEYRRETPQVHDYAIQNLDPSNCVPLPYVQRLKQDLEIAKRKIQECEETIVYQAHVIRRSSTLKTLHGIICPHCNQEVLHTCASTASESHCKRWLSPELGVRGSPIVNTTGREAQCGGHQQVTTCLGHSSAPSTSSVPGVSAPDSDNPSSAPSTTQRPISPSSTPLPSLTHSDKPDWTIEYNPIVDKAFEVKLVRTIVNKWGAFRVKFSQDGQLLAVAAYFGQVVTIYNVATGGKICWLEDLYEKEESPSTNDMSFSPNSKNLATCSDTIIRIWEISKKRIQNVFRGHRGCIYAVDFSPDGRRLISGSDDNTIRIWNMRDGSSRIFENPGSLFSSVRFSPDGRHVAAGTGVGDHLVWDLRSGHMGLLKGHDCNVPCIAFTPNGEGFISGSENRILKYWDISGSALAQIADGGELEERSTLTGHKDRIFSISVSSDSQWMASGSDDKTVRIWNIATDTQQCILRGHKKGVCSVDFSRAGGYLVSSGEDCTVRIWGYEAVTR